MSFRNTTDDKQKIPTEVKFNSQLTDIIDFSVNFCNDVIRLNEKLIEACINVNHFEVVKWLVEHTNVDINYSGEITTKNAFNEDVTGYYTPLTAACDKGCLEVVKYLVQSGASVNLAEREKKDSPLTAACGSGHIFIAMYLLFEIKDLDANICDSFRNSALHYAVSCYKRNNGRTRLHDACLENDLDKVWEIAYKKEYLINRQDNGGYTPLHYACMSNNASSIVITLMLMGADETSVNLFGQTPVDVANEMKNNDLVEFLSKETLWDAMQKKSSNNLVPRKLVKQKKRNRCRRSKRSKLFKRQKS